MLSRRQIVFAICFLVVPFLVWQFVSLNEEYSLSGPSMWPATICSAILPTKSDGVALSVPQKRHHAVVASTFGFHHDVYMSVVSTLERVMNQSQTGGTVDVYAPFPFGFEFQSIVESLHLYGGDVKSPDGLIDAINADTSIDVVILGTCEVECVAHFFSLRNLFTTEHSLRWGSWPEQLLSAWDARSADSKYKIVCIVHNVMVCAPQFDFYRPN